MDCDLHKNVHSTYAFCDFLLTSYWLSFKWRSNGEVGKPDSLIEMFPVSKAASFVCDCLDACIVICTRLCISGVHSIISDLYLTASHSDGAARGRRVNFKVKLTRPAAKSTLSEDQQHDSEQDVRAQPAQKKKRRRQ